MNTYILRLTYFSYVNVLNTYSSSQKSVLYVQNPESMLRLVFCGGTVLAIFKYLYIHF